MSATHWRRFSNRSRCLAMARNLHQPYTLLPILYFSRALPGTKVLLVTGSTRAAALRAVLYTGQRSRVTAPVRFGKPAFTGRLANLVLSCRSGLIIPQPRHTLMSPLLRVATLIALLALAPRPFASENAAQGDVEDGLRRAMAIGLIGHVRGSHSMPNAWTNAPGSARM